MDEDAQRLADEMRLLKDERMRVLRQLKEMQSDAETVKTFEFVKSQIQRCGTPQNWVYSRIALAISNSPSKDTIHEIANRFEAAGLYFNVILENIGVPQTESEKALLKAMQQYSGKPIVALVDQFYKFANGAYPFKDQCEVLERVVNDKAFSLYEMETALIGAPLEFYDTPCQWAGMRPSELIPWVGKILQKGERDAAEIVRNSGADLKLGSTVFRGKTVEQFVINELQMFV